MGRDGRFDRLFAGGDCGKPSGLLSQIAGALCPEGWLQVQRDWSRARLARPRLLRRAQADRSASGAVRRVNALIVDLREAGVHSPEAGSNLRYRAAISPEMSSSPSDAMERKSM